MSLCAAAISVHVIVEILGVGLVGAIPLVARTARVDDGVFRPTPPLLDLLFRYTRWSLVAALASRALLDFAAHGAFHEATWFRVSFGLLVFLGFCNARGRAALRMGAPLRRVAGWGWTMCASVAVLAVLVEGKPLP
jgi:hypothetical protein